MTRGTAMTCLLCGDQADVSMALVRYRGDGRYGSLPRCKDHAACRQRVERGGERWEVSDELGWRWDRTEERR